MLKYHLLFICFFIGSVLYGQSNASQEEIVQFAGIFQGKIGEKLGIEMKITCQDQKIAGTYFYNSQKINIKLEGAVIKNELIINEYTPKGEKTGTFTGQMSEDGSEVIGLNGKWTSADGKRSFPFTTNASFLKLTTRSNYNSGTYNFQVLTRTLVKKQEVMKENRDENFQYFLWFKKYPQISGLADAKIQSQFNLLLKNVAKEDKMEDFSFPVKKEVAEFGGDENYTSRIDFCYKNLITISSGSYGMMQGAAHPYHGGSGTTYFINTGKEVQLSDIFKGNYLAKINTWMKTNYQCKDEMSNMDNPDCITVKDKGENIPTFYLTNGNLVLDFAGSCGFPHAAQVCETQDIPLKELKDVINPAGALAGLVK
jgi:hypothetical protein